PVGDEGGGGEPSFSEGHLYSRDFSCPDCGLALPELEPRLFSFNSPHGACPGCSGLGVAPRVDPDLLIADPSRPFARGGLALFTPRGRPVHAGIDFAAIEELGRRFGFSLASSWGDLGGEARAALLTGSDGWPGLVAVIESIRSVDDSLLTSLVRELPCEACGGARLQPMARAVTFRDRSIVELCSLAVSDLAAFFESVELAAGLEARVGEPIRREILKRLGFLCDVGLPYLALERPTAT